MYKDEWKDAIQYRESVTYKRSIIYRIDFNLNNQLLPMERNIIRNVSFLIGELLYASFAENASGLVPG